MNSRTAKKQFSSDISTWPQKIKLFRLDRASSSIDLYASVFNTSEFLFMKHYAPNRCLYIKVAKLRTGVGSAEMSHLQNCSLKIYLKRALGEGRVAGGGGGVQDGCERRIELKFL